MDPPRTMDGSLGQSPMTAACGSLTPPRPVQIPDPGQSGGSVPEQDPEPDAPTEDRDGQLPQGTAAQHPGLRGSHRRGSHRRGQDAETPCCSGSGACPCPAQDEDRTTAEEESSRETRGVAAGTPACPVLSALLEISRVSQRL